MRSPSVQGPVLFPPESGSRGTVQNSLKASLNRKKSYLPIQFPLSRKKRNLPGCFKPQGGGGLASKSFFYGRREKNLLFEAKNFRVIMSILRRLRAKLQV